jgi:hypothetical protein
MSKNYFKSIEKRLSEQGETISFFPELRDVTDDSIEAALVLSLVFEWDEEARISLGDNNAERWFTKPQNEWSYRTGLGHKTILAAQQLLSDKGFIKAERRDRATWFQLQTMEVMGALLICTTNTKGSC